MKHKLKLMNWKGKIENGQSKRDCPFFRIDKKMCTDYNKQNSTR